MEEIALSSLGVYWIDKERVSVDWRIITGIDWRI